MTFVIDDSCIHIQKVNRSKYYSIAAVGASRFRHGHIIVHIVSSRFERGDEVIQSLNLRTDRILPRDGIGPQRLQHSDDIHVGKITHSRGRRHSHKRDCASLRDVRTVATYAEPKLWML